jgi:hypothetical protein
MTVDRSSQPAQNVVDFFSEGTHAMSGFSRSLKRSIRQLISFAVAGAGGYFTFIYVKESRIFASWGGGEWLLPGLCAVGAFVVLFWASMTFISGKAAT